METIPKTDSEKLFYGKTPDYEEIKNKLDRTSSLYSQVNQEYKNGYVLPLAVNVLEKNQNNESNLVSYKDGVDCDNAKIVKMLKNKKYTITTSQASLGEIINILDPIYDKYDEFYALPITSSTSGSENT